MGMGTPMNNVPPGYKQTEVGVIPEDWECGKLEDYFSFISYGFTNPMPTVSHGIYMITAADINKGRIQLETARNTTEVAYRTLLSPKSKPKKNDILLTKDGSLGRLALVGDEVVCINQSVAVIRPNEKAEPNFLKLLLESPRYQKRMIEDAGGSTIKHIYITIVNLMQIAVPSSREEQRAIATALSDVDALLGGLERLIAKKRNLKQAAMQQLLTGQTRLPGFHGEWEVKTISDLCEYQNGTSLEHLFNQTDGLKVISIGNYSVAGNYVDNGVYINEKHRKFVDKFVLRRNDLAMSLYDKTAVGAIIGRVLLITQDDLFVFNQRTMRLRPRNDVSPSYLHHAINSDFVHSALVGLAKPGTQIYVNTDDVLSLNLFVPPEPEQTAIAAVLTDMDAELTLLTQRLAKTRALKQGMMQELLTGRTRLV